MVDLFNSKSIRKSWLFSYALIVFICLIALLCVILISRATIKQEITKNNSHIVSLATRELSQIKYDADNLSIKLQTSSVIAPFFEHFTAGTNTALSLKECISEIDNMIIPYSFIDSVCIYNPSTDNFITLDGLLRANFEYKNFVFDSINAESYESWKKGILEKRFHELYLSGDGKIFHITSTLDKKDSAGSVIIITLNQYALEQLISGINSSFEDVIILNHASCPVFSQNDSVFVNMASSDMIDYNAENKTYFVQNRDFIVYLSHLDSNLTCLFAIAENTVYKRLNVFVGIIIFCLLPVLFVIIWLMLFYSKKHYSPVEKLLYTLANYRSENNNDSNEFTEIEAGLNSLIDQVKNDQHINENYHKKLFEEDFFNYLKKTPCHRNLLDLFALYNVNFLHNNYLVAIISINNISEELWETNSEDSEEANSKLIPIAISNIYSELLGTEFELLSIKTSADTLFCFIGSSCVNNEDMLGLVKEKTILTGDMISKQIGIDIFVYLSDCFSDIEKTRAVYKQLEHIYTFEQISYSSNVRVLSFNDFKENTNIFLFETKFEEQFEEHLSRALSSSDPQNSKNIIDQFLRNYGDMLTVSHFIIIKHILLNKVTSNINLSDVKLSANELYSLIERIDHISTAKQLYAIIFEIIDTLAKFSHSPDITDLVKEYIDQNFADSNLNVNMLGEKFNLTAPYLSRLFKQKTGEMLKDYIKKVRLTYARELLKTEMKIEDVARNCGFVDSKLFIRTFKLYYDVPPGQYRKLYI